MADQMSLIQLLLQSAVRQQVTKKYGPGRFFSSSDDDMFYPSEKSEYPRDFMLETGNFLPRPKNPGLPSFLNTFIENTLKGSIDAADPVPMYTLTDVVGMACMVEISDPRIGRMVCSKDVKMLSHKQRHFIYAPYYELNILRDIFVNDVSVDGRTTIIENSLACYERLKSVHNSKNQEVRMIGEIVVLVITDVNVQSVQSVNKTVREYPDLDLSVVVVVDSPSPFHMELIRIEEQFETDAPKLNGYSVYDSNSQKFVLMGVTSLESVGSIFRHLTSDVL